MLGTKTEVSPSNEEKYNDVLAGTAQILCVFCHRFWTICERYHLAPYAPLTKHDYEAILKQFPLFIEYFLQLTADFDWESEATRRRAMHSFVLQRLHVKKTLLAQSQRDKDDCENEDMYFKSEEEQEEEEFERHLID